MKSFPYHFLRYFYFDPNPSYLLPLFSTSPRANLFWWEWVQFRMNGFARILVLTQRQNATWEWRVRVTAQVLLLNKPLTCFKTAITISVTITIKIKFWRKPSYPSVERLRKRIRVIPYQLPHPGIWANEVCQINTTTITFSKASQQMVSVLITRLTTCVRLLRST